MSPIHGKQRSDCIVQTYFKVLSEQRLIAPLAGMVKDNGGAFIIKNDIECDSIEYDEFKNKLSNILSL